MARETTSYQGSYLQPDFERARVSDAMRAGVLTCPPETSLKTVARMMATYHVHSIVVTAPDGEGESERAWGVVSDTDVVAAAGPDIDYQTAGGTAATEVITVEAEETLKRAAQTMSEHEITHLIVVSAGSQRPVGVLSTLDIAGILAWGRGV
jgi:CBS domain-containing protein